MRFEDTENSSMASEVFNARWLVFSVTVLLWLGILMAYRSQVALVVNAWETLPSHAHGYVVILVVAYLAWSKRHALAGMAPAPCKAGILALALSGAAAFAGEMVAANVVVQFAIVFMLMSVVWAVLGARYFRILFGPLVFLFFTIPFGHDILPTLMDWTANATVIGLRASGVPVFQQDRIFVIPNGHWSVVEACAGIRYLFTSLFIGSIFAYITYTRWQKRLIFILWMLALSLIANWLRAYVIVMSAYLSNNQWGLGMSHLAFGWIVFAAIVFVSFAVGVRWHDPEIRIKQMHSGEVVPLGKTTGTALLALAVVLGWSQSANYLLNLPSRPMPVLDLSNSLGDLVKTSPALEQISPRFLGATAIHEATYRFKDGEIGLWIGYYRNQRQGAKLISVFNVIEPTHTWAWNRSSRMQLQGDHIPALQVEYFSKANVKAEAASVYWVGGWTTTSDVMSKFYQAINLVLGKGDDAARVVISATTLGSAASANALVEAFVRERLPRVLANLDAIQTGSAQ